MRLALAFMLTAFATTAQAEVVVRERIVSYRIDGADTASLARAMSRRGPYLPALRHRAWATATRDLRYELKTRRTNGECRIAFARVFLDIVYRLPRATGIGNGREAKRWKRMRHLLETHERAHGKLYRRLARRADRALARMKPRSTCRALRRDAGRLVAELSARNRAANAAFDVREGANYRRMLKLFADR